MWMFTNEGIYSVKSGYSAIRHKVFLWRILNKALPVREELDKRGINCSLLCPRCEESIESIDHIFLKCDRTRRELFGSNLGINFQISRTTDFIDWLISFIYKTDKPTIISLASLLYSIWHSRNQRVFEDKIIPEEVIIHRACNSVFSFRNARSGTIDPHHTGNRTILASRLARATAKVKWIKPHQGVIKINCDANLTSEDVWGIGVITRNDNGIVMASGTWNRPGFMCPITAEAWGVYQAALFALDQGFQNVLFENDNEKLISMLSREEEGHRSYLGSIIQSIISLVPRFRFCGFSHVKREGNVVAHCLAMIATVSLNQVWVDIVPAQAQSCIAVLGCI
ncbi:putative ribonuclease H-like domain, reverse transcriptase zinc-binding domain-containing protein [Medicago truncatula]|uniref:Putative ribonuclease H-like domain, reverse transcriptase zinc-binding domain-containing protein n=1 Tax=Medicago truncatula TaxID=3880 RepID=A0A396HMK9_MEDTR|nr:putative ribonuclease H-like domain, reverse transcriptase zinc-binding domain-containing protein [Medicago truncatula]